MEEEADLLELMGQRGFHRAAIIRKEAAKEFRRQRRKEKGKEKEPVGKRRGKEIVNEEEEEDEYLSHVLAELYLPPDPDVFLESDQSKYWKRGEGKSYHLAKLQDQSCPLSGRISEWEPLEAQPLKLVPSKTLRNAWRKNSAEDFAQRSMNLGDDANFRDIESIAEQLDFYGTSETHFKLCTIKPQGFSPQHANSIVLYLFGHPDVKEQTTSRRVTGSVVFDSQGKARVDVNFQHHCMEHSRYLVLSGHWHILDPGEHAHKYYLDDGLVEDADQQHRTEDHNDWKSCPWIWQAIPSAFDVKPRVPIGH